MSKQSISVELKQEQLEKVSGGVTNTLEQGPKYGGNTEVKYRSNIGNGIVIFGTITGSAWNANHNQFQYQIMFDGGYFDYNGEPVGYEGGEETILEENIICLRW